MSAKTISIGSPLDLILVGRLREVYWGSVAQSWTEARVRCAPPQSAYLDVDQRTPEWDLGRVHHFVQLLEARQELDPIVIDSRVYGLSWGPPFVWDGHHRFVAAVLVRRRRILASCGGLVTSIEWLTGERRRDRRPPEITG